MRVLTVEFLITFSYFVGHIVVFNKTGLQQIVIIVYDIKISYVLVFQFLLDTSMNHAPALSNGKGGLL